MVSKAHPTAKPSDYVQGKLDFEECKPYDPPQDEVAHVKYRHGWNDAKKRAEEKADG